MSFLSSRLASGEPALVDVSGLRDRMLRLRARRRAGASVADPGLRARLSAILDGDGSAEQDQAIDDYIGAKPPGRRKERTAALLGRVRAERGERWGLVEQAHWRLDDAEMVDLRCLVWASVIRRADADAYSALNEDEHRAWLSQVWDWLSTLPDPPEEPPPWIDEVSAFRAAEARRQRDAVDDALGRVERWLAAHAPRELGAMRPGAAPAALDAFEVALGRRLPGPFRQLLQWHDGAGLLIPVRHGYRLMSLESVEASREMLCALPDRGAGGWSPAWVPILETPSGDHLVVDLEGSFTGVAGQVIAWYHDDPRATVEALDMDSWLDTLAAAFESGVFAPKRGTLVERRSFAWRRLVACRTGLDPISVELPR